MWFNLLWTGLLGAILGFLTAQGDYTLMLPYLGLGFLIFSILAYISINFLKSRIISSIFCTIVLLLTGVYFFGVAYAIIIAVFGWILGAMSHLSLIHI